MTSLHALPHYVESKASYDLLVGRKVRRISDADLHELLLDVTSVPESTIVDELLERWSVFAGENIDMADVEVMLRTGHVPANVLQAISQTSRAAVEEIRVQARGVARDMAAGWLNGVDGVDLEAVQALTTGEADLHEAITAALDQRAEQLAVDLTDGQQLALDMLVSYYAEIAPSPASALAARIPDFVGLTEREARAVLNYRDGLAQEGLTGRALEGRVAQYADHLEHVRALRIARTEMAYAATEGQYEGLAEARDQGLVVGKVYRRWTTADDEVVCPVCGDLLEGMIAAEGESFTDEYDDPPAHPACRCSADLIEVIGE